MPGEAAVAASHRLRIVGAIPRRELSYEDAQQHDEDDQGGGSGNLLLVVA
jgi:hypothetical protein